MSCCFNTKFLYNIGFNILHQNVFFNCFFHGIIYIYRWNLNSFDNFVKTNVKHIKFDVSANGLICSLFYDNVSFIHQVDP